MIHYPNIGRAADIASSPEPYDAGSVASALHHQGYAHVRGILEDTLLVQLHEQLVEMDGQNELVKAGVGRGDDYAIESAIRRDYTKWIEGNTLSECVLLERLEQVRLQLNEKLMLGLFDVEAHFAVYYLGSFYARHSDSFRGAKNRLLSLVIYLNHDWKTEYGGMLNLHNDDEDKEPMVSVLPERGHAVFFLSEEIPHEVTTSLRTRYSIAAWFRRHQPL